MGTDNVNLRRFSFGEPIRSKKHNENYQDIQTSIGNIDARVESLEAVGSGGTSPAEVVSSRFTYNSLNEMLSTTLRAFGNGVVSDISKQFADTDTTSGWMFEAGIPVGGAIYTAEDYVLNGTNSIASSYSTGASTFNFRYGSTNTSLKNKTLSFSLLQTSIGANALTSVKLYAYDGNLSGDYFRYDFSAADIFSGNSKTWVTLSKDFDDYDAVVGSITTDSDVSEYRFEFTFAGNVDPSIIRLDACLYSNTSFDILPDSSIYPKVNIYEGIAIVNGYPVSTDEVSATLSAKPSTNDRIDIITIDTTGTIRVYTGDESATPSAFETPNGQLKLGEVYRRSTESAITTFANRNATDAYITATHPVIIAQREYENFVAIQSAIPQTKVYVDNTGITGFSTIQSALTHIATNTGGYGEIYVKKGTYTETLSYTGINAVYMMLEYATTINGTPYYTTSPLFVNNTGINTTPTGVFAVALGQLSTSSGNFSFSSGYDATATDAYAFAHGFDANATAQNSTAIGNDVDATGLYSVALGRSNTSSGVNSTTFGYNNTNSGQSAIVAGENNVNTSGDYNLIVGKDNSATAQYNTIIGYNGKAYRDGQFVQANGGFGNVQGNGQFSRVVYLNGTNILTSTLIIPHPIPNNTCHYITLTFTATDEANNTSGFAKRMVIIKNINGTTSLTGAVQTIGTDIHNIVAFGLALTANDTTDTLDIVFHYNLTALINTVCVIESVETLI